MTRYQVTKDELKSLENHEVALDKALSKPFASIMSLTIGLVIGLLIVLSIGADAGVFLSSIFKGSFGSLWSFGNFLSHFTWLALTGLAFTIAFRVKLFNIGIVAQMLFGAIAANAFAAFVDMGPSGFIFTILVGALAGGMAGYLISFMKTHLHIHEVVSSIMLNWIAFLFLQLYVSPGVMPINEGNSMKQAWLQWMPGTSNLMLWVTLAVLGIFAFVYKMTKWGFKTKSVGFNRQSSNAYGINVKSIDVQSMTLSGAVAGLAGVAYYLGTQGNLPSLSEINSLPQEGFQGIAVSLIAFGSPMGIVASAAVFSVLTTGTVLVQANMSSFSAQIVIAVIVWSAASAQFLMIIKPIDSFKRYAIRKNWMVDPTTITLKGGKR